MSESKDKDNIVANIVAVVVIVLLTVGGIAIHINRLETRRETIKKLTGKEVTPWEAWSLGQ